MLNLGVFSHPNLYPFLCKIGVKNQNYLLETTQNRGLFFTHWTIMRYAFEYEVTIPGRIVSRD